MAQKNDKKFEHDLMKQYVGKNVEIMLRPDIPVVSGRFVRFNENYVIIGDAVLAYPLIWGIRPVNNNDKHEKQENNVNTPHKQQPQKKNEIQQQNDENKEPENKELENEDDEIYEKPEFQWHDKIFEGELAYFNHTFGFILSSDLEKFKVPILEEGKIFIHYNQISDPDLREKLQQLKTEKNSRPGIPVIFKLGSNEKGYVADDVREKKDGSSEKKENDENSLSVNIASVLSDEEKSELLQKSEEDTRLTEN